MNFLERWKEKRAWWKGEGPFARMRRAYSRSRAERAARDLEAIDRLIEQYKRKLAEQEKEK